MHVVFSCDHGKGQSRTAIKMLLMDADRDTYHAFDIMQSSSVIYQNDVLYKIYMTIILV